MMTGMAVRMAVDLGLHLVRSDFFEGIPIGHSCLVGSWRRSQDHF